MQLCEIESYLIKLIGVPETGILNRRKQVKFRSFFFAVQVAVQTEPTDRSPNGAGPRRPLLISVTALVDSLVHSLTVLQHDAGRYRSSQFPFPCYWVPCFTFVPSWIQSYFR